MKLDDFLNSLAQRARQEHIPVASPRDAVLQRLHGFGGDAIEEGRRTLFWTVALTGAAACVSLVASFEAYSLLTDPLGLFIGLLGYLPLEA